MNILQEDGYLRISDMGAFSVEQTFDCGQCFRFKKLEDGSFYGVAFGKYVRMRNDGEDLLIACKLEDFNTIWRSYLDLDRDYDAIMEAFITDEFTKNTAEFGRGIRILKQEPWEALCSFIVSQCNNIPRIQSIINKLCDLFGDDIVVDNVVHKSFPSAEKIAMLELEDLAPLRCGYRAPYILEAARRIVSGEINFNVLDKMDTPTARKEMTKTKGIGIKVADCFLLFGMAKLDAFPIDTWMKKAKAFYDGDMSAEKYGKYAGIYQQYIFHYARNQKIG